MNIDLKPCPFWGGEARIRTTITTSIPRHAKAWCYCEKCLSSGQSFIDNDDDGTCVIKAVEAWDRRANNDN